MYVLHTTEHLDKILKRLSKKNPKQFEIIQRKVEQILQNPLHFKPLRAPLQNKRRVHIDKSFVLVYSVDENNKTVILEDFDHHDNIYAKGR